MRRLTSFRLFSFALCGMLLATGAAAQTTARCVNEEALPSAPGAEPLALPASDPREQLAMMVRDAHERSQALGAARLLAEAALDDVAEARGAKALQASAGASVGPGGNYTLGVSESAQLQLRGSISVSQLLYDGGRSDRMTDWRAQTAAAARFGQLSQQEQLSLSTVALALERNRFRQHVLVYAQQVRKMACLTEALETIVRNDRGRASELVQARKSLQQAEVSQAQSQSSARMIELRLRRLVGDGLPSVEGLSALLLQVPSLPELVADVEISNEVSRLAAQAAAADKYAQAVQASGKPQIGWSVAGGAGAGIGISSGTTRNGSYAAGVNISIPLLSPGLAPASDAARKRAQAALLQRSELLEQQRSRVSEVYEQSANSFDRARRLAALLRDSEQVRNFTLQQWQQIGKRSLFDVMAAESEHYGLRVAYVNALHDGQQANALLLSLGRGVGQWLR